MHVSRIRIHPIKSLDGVEVTEAEVTSLGALRRDREWALVDREHRWLNAKRNPLLHGIRCRFSADLRQVSLTAPGGSAMEASFDELPALEDWFSSLLGEPVILMRDSEQGFPDDLKANGPTVISEASLGEIASWFSLDLEQTRMRFRSNIEITGGPAFWEDRLVGLADEPVEFSLGDLRLRGINPCQRCAVPSRDPATGAVHSGFQKIFMTKRLETLPPWTDRSQFDHFYRAAVNTQIEAGQVGKRLRLGSPVFLHRLAS